MQEIVEHVAQLSFPIAISLYLLVRTESKLEKLTESINDLKNSIDKMC